MTTLIITLALTFSLIIIALLLLGISWVFTGKSRLHVGMCGRIPTQKRSKDAGCGTSVTCALCGKKDEPEPKEKS